MKAIVLKKKAFSDHDLILDFFVESGKRLSGFAPSARRSKKRFPHQFYPTAVYDLQWSREPVPHRLSRISKAELVHFYPAYTQNLSALGKWSCVQEWILLDENFEGSFQKVHGILENLCGDQSRQVFRDFFMNQIKVHGLRPELDDCVHCQQLINEDQKRRFSFSEGGVGHRTCVSGKDLNLNQFRYLKHFFEASGLFSENTLSASENEDLSDLSVRFLETQMGYELKSYRFFKSLKTTPPWGKTLIHG